MASRFVLEAVVFLASVLTHSLQAISTVRQQGVVTPMGAVVAAATGVKKF